MSINAVSKNKESETKEGIVGRSEPFSGGGALGYSDPAHVHRALRRWTRMHHKTTGNKKWQELTFLGLHEDVTGQNHKDVIQDSGYLKTISLH